jgi:hypothetical protein
LVRLLEYGMVGVRRQPDNLIGHEKRYRVHS